MVQEKEDVKKKKALEKNKGKEVREKKKAEKMAATKKDTSRQEMPTQESSGKTTNEQEKKTVVNTFRSPEVRINRVLLYYVDYFTQTS